MIASTVKPRLQQYSLVPTDSSFILAKFLNENEGHFLFYQTLELNIEDQNTDFKVY